MGRFDRFSGTRSSGGSRDRGPRRDRDDDDGGFEGHQRSRERRGGSRDFGKRSFSRDSRGPPRRSGNENTKVICSKCNKECEVPFKPVSSKPIYCDDCFVRPSEHDPSEMKGDLEAIKQKLNKIMKALKIE